MTRCSIIFAVLLAASLGACATDEPVDIYTRACNDTGSDITDMRYWRYSTPALSAGACTDYGHSTEAVSPDPYAAFTIDSVGYVNWGDDVVGHSLIESGHWTYRLTIYDAERHIADVEAVADE